MRSLWQLHAIQQDAQEDRARAVRCQVTFRSERMVTERAQAVCHMAIGQALTEWLMDVANFAMIEFMHPRDPRARFSATPAEESPGRVWAPDEEDGSVEVSQRANDMSI